MVSVVVEAEVVGRTTEQCKQDERSSPARLCLSLSLVLSQARKISKRIVVVIMIVVVIGRLSQFSSE